MIDKILEFAVEILQSEDTEEIKNLTRSFFGNAVKIMEKKGELEIHVSEEYEKFSEYIVKMIKISYRRNKNKMEKFNIWPFLRKDLLTNSLEYNDNLVTKNQIRIPFGILEILFRIFRFKDYETRDHITRTGIISAKIAKAMKKDDIFVSLIRFAAPLHDIGKLLIPNEILLKPGKLTEEEWEIVKKHTIIGWSILKDTASDVLHLAANSALTHHERWNGTGYPMGLKEKEIPIEGRIVAVADSLDAMICNRPYKRSKSLDEAFCEINDLSRIWYDPEVVEVLNTIKRDIEELYNVRTTEESLPKTIQLRHKMDNQTRDES